MAEYIVELLSILMYGSVFFFVLLGLFMSAFALYDDAAMLFWQGENDWAWLYLMLIPIELIVGILFFITMVPYIF